MGTHFNQLTLDERYQIQALNELGHSARQIALKLNRSNKTISNELARCKAARYQASSAHQRALSKRHHSAKSHKRTATLVEFWGHLT